MHMSDALLSPAVGGVMWAATAGLGAWCARRVRPAAGDPRVPLMGVLGAFVFAGQMINFSIPGTGSSGHLGGGLLLAILLGPHAAFLTLASVLLVQALFFADGGLLALGCNVFNMAVFPCFIAYPLVYRPLARLACSGAPGPSSKRLALAAVPAAMTGLALGALAVVAQTVASGVSALPPGAFTLAMLPIHLAIGAVEGLVTAAVVALIAQARPELLAAAPASVESAAAAIGAAPRRSLRPVLYALLAAAALTGGVLSWVASGDPDGLEWSIARVSGRESGAHARLAEPESEVHGAMARLQQRVAVLPDYDLPASGAAPPAQAQAASAVQPGTSLAGLAGGAITLAIVTGLGMALRPRRTAG